MSRLSVLTTGLCVALTVFLATTRNNGASAATKLPDPFVDELKAEKKGQERLVVAGGCFWGVQAVFEHVKGVSHVTAGYSGGTLKNPDYETVSSGSTGHAESEKIVYDPSQVTLGQLLGCIFSPLRLTPLSLIMKDRTREPSIALRSFFATSDQKRIAESAYGTTRRCEAIFPSDCHADRSAHRFLPCRGIPPRLCRATSRQQSLHRQV